MDNVDRASELIELRMDHWLSARQPLLSGPVLLECVDCGGEIPARRRLAMQEGCCRCAECQAITEKRDAAARRARG